MQWHSADRPVRFGYCGHLRRPTMKPSCGCHKNGSSTGATQSSTISAPHAHHAGRRALGEHPRQSCRPQSGPDPRVRISLAAGVAAAQLGTVFMRCQEAGTSTVVRDDALTVARPPVLTRAFTGPWARSLGVGSAPSHRGLRLYVIRPPKAGRWRGTRQALGPRNRPLRGPIPRDINRRRMSNTALASPDRAATALVVLWAPTAPAEPRGDYRY